MASALFHWELSDSVATSGACRSTELLFFVLPSGLSYSGSGFLLASHCFKVNSKSEKASPAWPRSGTLYLFACINPIVQFFLIGSCCVVWIFKQLLTEWQLTDCIDRFSFENLWNWVQFAKLSQHSNDNEFWFPGTDIRLLIKLCASAFNLLQIIGKCNEAFQLKHGFMLFNNTPIIL